ncbi:hypothetical protein GCM10027516_35410 [Niabella aquatica]
MAIGCRKNMAQENVEPNISSFIVVSVTTTSANFLFDASNYSALSLSIDEGIPIIISGTSYTATGLNPGKNYSAVLTATNSNGSVRSSQTFTTLQSSTGGIGFPQGDLVTVQPYCPYGYNSNGDYNQPIMNRPVQLNISGINNYYQRLQEPRAVCFHNFACLIDMANTGISSEERTELAKLGTSSVALAIPLSDGTFGTFCSGTLVRSSKDNNYYIVTANHCFDDKGYMANVYALFNYQTDYCSGQVDFSKIKDNNIAVYVYLVHKETDFALLQLATAPPTNIIPASISLNSLTFNDDRIVSISHPFGLEKKASFVNQCLPYQPYYPNQYVISTIGEQLDHGSSGSGIFSKDRNTGVFSLVGTLTGPLFSERRLPPCGSNIAGAYDNPMLSYGRLNRIKPTLQKLFP